MRKYIVLLILVLLTVGCKAKYNININADKSVEESVIGLEDDEFYNKYHNYSKEKVIKFATFLVDNYLDKNNYSREIVKDKGYTGEKVEKKFKNLNEYFSNSKVYNQLYESFDTSIDGKIVTISLKNRYPKNGNSVDKYIIDDCEVTVTLPFLVKENNADKYNKETNSYTWNLNIDDDKEIYIQFDMSKKVIKSNSNFTIVYIAICIVILISIVIFMIFNSKKKSHNEI